MKVIEAFCGEHITDTAKRVVKKAKSLKECITLKHNDVEVEVSPESFWRDIVTIWDLKFDRPSCK